MRAEAAGVAQRRVRRDVSHPGGVGSGSAAAGSGCHTRALNPADFQENFTGPKFLILRK